MECTNWLNISGLAVSLADLKLFSKARTSLAWSLEAWSFWSGWLKIRLDARVSVNRWLVAEGVGLPTSFTWRRTLAMAPEEAELKGWKTCVSVQSEDSNRPSPNTVTWQECSLLKRNKQELNIGKLWVAMDFWPACTHAHRTFQFSGRTHVCEFSKFESHPQTHVYQKGIILEQILYFWFIIRLKYDHGKRLKQCENEKLCSFFSKKCAKNRIRMKNSGLFCLKTCEIAIALRTSKKRTKRTHICGTSHTCVYDFFRNS